MDPKERERIILLGGIALVAVVVVVFLFSQVAGRASRLDNEIRSQKRIYRELQELAVEYRPLMERSVNMENRLLKKGPPLLSRLENLCRNSRIENPSLNPRRTSENEYYEETSVELKAKGLNLEKLMNLLGGIENSPQYLRIKSFKMETPYAKKELLDVTLQISSYSPREEAPAATPPEEGPND